MKNGVICPIHNIHRVKAVYKFKLAYQGGFDYEQTVLHTARGLADGICFTVLLMPVSIMAAGADGHATLVKSYNKDGKFSMVIDLTYPDNGYATFEIFLTDASGNVYARWNNISSNYTFGTRQYTFSRSYADTPDGQYKMNVVATNGYGNSKNFSWTVNHKKTVSIAFKDTYKVKNADGTYSQQFNFTSVNGKGKTYHVELYTNDGKLVKSFSFTDPVIVCVNLFHFK
jgi:hypothetical protein